MRICSFKSLLRDVKSNELLHRFLLVIQGGTGYLPRRRRWVRPPEKILPFLAIPSLNRMTSVPIANVCAGGCSTGFSHQERHAASRVDSYRSSGGNGRWIGSAVPCRRLHERA